MQNEKYEKAKSAVITVGSGRGFVIEHGHDRYVCDGSALPAEE